MFFTHTFYNDAARRVATSSEARENRFQTSVFQKGDRGKTPYGSILWGAFPFLGKEFSIKKFHFSKNVAMRRAASVKMALHF